MATNKDIAFVREIFRTVLGLEERVIDNVIREIRSQADFTALKTQMIRGRIGAQAMRLIRNGIHTAKNYTEVEDDEDESALSDPEGEDEAVRPDDEEDPLRHAARNRAMESVERPKGKSLRENITKDASKKSLGQQILIPAMRHGLGTQTNAMINKLKKKGYSASEISQFRKKVKQAAKETADELDIPYERDEENFYGLIFDVSDHDRVEDQFWKKVEQKLNTKQTNENTSGQALRHLKEFLVDVDPDNPEELQRIRKMIVQAQRPGGEERLARQLVQRADDERDKARENGNTPIGNIDKQLARLRQQAALLFRRRAALQRREDEEKNGAQMNEGINLNEFEHQINDYLNKVMARIRPDDTPDMVMQKMKGLPQHAAATWAHLRGTNET